MTEHEADIASAGMMVAIHMAERFASILKDYYLQETEQHPRYNELLNHITAELMKGGVKYQHARERATREAHDLVSKFNDDTFNNGNGLRYAEWKAAAENFERLTERITGRAINAKQDETKSDAQMFDALLFDVNNMCRLFCLYGNIPEDKHLQMESMLKALGTKHTISTEFINEQFTPVI